MPRVELPKYRKKPVEIHAIRWTGTNVEEVARWAALAHHAATADQRKPGDATKVDLPIDLLSLGDGRFRLEIQTLEGRHTANDGDWIICGVKGEFYPCKPDIFEMTYERVSR